MNSKNSTKGEGRTSRWYLLLAEENFLPNLAGTRKAKPMSGKKVNIRTARMALKAALVSASAAAAIVIFPQNRGLAQAETAQQEQPQKRKSLFSKFSVGLSVGATIPFTDIKQYDFAPALKNKNELQPGVSAFINYALNNIVGIDIYGMWGKLQGTTRANQTVEEDKSFGPSFTKPMQQERLARLNSWGFADAARVGDGVYFSTNILEGGLRVKVNFSNIAFSPRKSGKERKWAVYGFASHGLVRFESQVKRLSDDKEYKAYKRGYSGKVTEAVNQLGFGFSLRLANALAAHLEGAWHFVHNDKLDGLEAGQANDLYTFARVGVQYYFGVKPEEGVKPLEWVNPLEALYAEMLRTQEAVGKLLSDKDNDGVPDYYDKEPSSPEGATVDGSGKTMDIDKDGVPDFKDADPFTTPGATVDAEGRAIDSDGDGVPDAFDLEPNTPSGALVDARGREIKLPKAGATPAGGAMAGAAVASAYFPSIYFAFNSAVITSANYERLATIARALKANPGIHVTLVGHADPIGSEEYNLKLAERRAKAVKNFLVKNFGIEPDRLHIEAKGEVDLLSKSIHSVNRRVDVVVKQ